MRDAASARDAAGLTLADAARLARISRAYLRRLERSGGFPFSLATRLSRIYGSVPLDLFLNITDGAKGADANTSRRPGHAMFAPGPDRGGTPPDAD